MNGVFYFFAQLYNLTITMKGGIAVVDGINWNEIKAEYIAGGTTYSELAAKFNISHSTLRKKAAKEQWSEQRNKAGAKAEQKIIEAVSDDQAKKAVTNISLIDDIYNATLQQLKTKAESGKLKTYELESVIRSASKIGEQIGYKPHGDGSDGDGVTFNIIF